MSEAELENDKDLDFRMTDLEEQLAGENAAQVRLDVLKKLIERGGKLRETMDAGLSKEKYEKTERAYQALAAAHEIIINYPVNQTNDLERRD